MKISNSLIKKLIREALTQQEVRDLVQARREGQNNLKKAYRKLAMRYHPDRNPGNSDAEGSFTQAAEINSILQDSKGIEDLKEKLQRARTYEQFKPLYQLIAALLRPNVEQLMTQLDQLYLDLTEGDRPTKTMFDYEPQGNGDYTLISSLDEDDNSPRSPRNIFRRIVHNDLGLQQKIILSAVNLSSFRYFYSIGLNYSKYGDNQEAKQALLRNLGFLVDDLRKGRIRLNQLDNHLDNITSFGLDERDPKNPRSVFRRLAYREIR